MSGFDEGEGGGGSEALGEMFLGVEDGAAVPFGIGDAAEYVAASAGHDDA